jgi:hypothetical protein
MTVKFKKGHWMVKPFVPAAVRGGMVPHPRDGDAVEMLVPGQKVGGRQDTMGRR